MRNSITIDNSDVIKNQRINTLVNLGGKSVDSGKESILLIKGLLLKIVRTLSKYIEQLGLEKDPNHGCSFFSTPLLL